MTPPLLFISSQAHFIYEFIGFIYHLEENIYQRLLLYFPNNIIH